MKAYKIIDMTKSGNNSRSYTLADIKTGKVSKRLDEESLKDSIRNNEIEVINAKMGIAFDPGYEAETGRVSFDEADSYYMEEYRKYNRALFLNSTLEHDGFGRIAEYSKPKDDPNILMITECNYILGDDVKCEVADLSSRHYATLVGLVQPHTLMCKDLVFETPECAKEAISSGIPLLCDTMSLKNKGDYIDFKTFKEATGMLGLYVGYVPRNDIGSYNEKWAIILDMKVKCTHDELLGTMQELLESLRRSTRRELSEQVKDITTDTEYILQQLAIYIGVYNAASGSGDKKDIQRECIEGIKEAFERLNRAIMAEQDIISKLIVYPVYRLYSYLEDKFRIRGNMTKYMKSEYGNNKFKRSDIYIYLKDIHSNFYWSLR